MTPQQKRVLFLKDGGPHGYAVKEGQRGVVYDIDIPYLLNLGVIKKPRASRAGQPAAEAAQVKPLEIIEPKQSFWAKLFTR